MKKETQAHESCTVPSILYGCLYRNTSQKITFAYNSKCKRKVNYNCTKQLDTFQLFVGKYNSRVK
jgi:hypothetical protein